MTYKKHVWFETSDNVLYNMISSHTNVCTDQIYIFEYSAMHSLFFLYINNSTSRKFDCGGGGGVQ